MKNTITLIYLLLATACIGWPVYTLLTAGCKEIPTETMYLAFVSFAAAMLFATCSIVIYYDDEVKQRLEN